MLRRKLRGSGGTTLIEVLCALVVLAMCTAFFVTTVSAAGRLNAMARESEEKLYTALGVAETQNSSDAVEDDAVTLKAYLYQAGSDTTPLLFEEEITLYGDADSLLSYRLR